MYMSANVSDNNIYSSLITLLVTSDVMLSTKCKSCKEIDECYFRYSQCAERLLGVEEATESVGGHLAYDFLLQKWNP